MGSYCQKISKETGDPDFPEKRELWHRAQSPSEHRSLTAAQQVGISDGARKVPTLGLAPSIDGESIMSLAETSECNVVRGPSYFRQLQPW